MPWSSNLRAIVKWWVNPLSWYDATRYSLCRKQCLIEMEEGVPVLITSGAKDWGYIVSQSKQFLLKDGWSSVWFSPYVVAHTEYILTAAITRRFREVEKVALELSGFKEVILLRGRYPESKNMEWMISAIKK